MNYLAVRAHDRAENSFDVLESRCGQVQERCALGPGGTYADPEIEGLYQTSLRYDRRARLWLIGVDLEMPNGRRFADEEMHLFEFNDAGQVVLFRHYVDTAKAIAAVG